MNRRAVIAAPAALAAATLPVEAAHETPLEAAYREWKKAQDFMSNETKGWPDDEFEALVSRISDYERQMMNMPCQNARDWIIKSVMWTDFGGWEMPSEDIFPNFWNEARALIGGAA